MSAFQALSPAEQAGGAALTAVSNAQGALVFFLARGATLDDGLNLTALKRAVESVNTAMKRLADVIEMLPNHAEGADV